MKKTKKSRLSLDKFEVCKLNNIRSITGGDVQDKKTTTSKKCPKPDSGPLCPKPQDPDPDPQPGPIE